jgi:hypothetical protein
VLFNGPAAPPLPDPLLPLESPGSEVEPDPVFPRGPLPVSEPEPLPPDPLPSDPLPAVPPLRVESGSVLGWLPVPVGLHPPPTVQSVLGAAGSWFVESCAAARVGAASIALSKIVAANFILNSSGC